MPFVLLHAGWPYVRELSYLCALYPNVYMDLSLAIPFTTTAIPNMIHEAFSLAPITKIMYASDGYSIPELFWVANKWGRAALEKVLGEIVDAGALTMEQAQRAGWRIWAAMQTLVRVVTPGRWNRTTPNRISVKTLSAR